MASTSLLLLQFLAQIDLTLGLFVLCNVVLDEGVYIVLELYMLGLVELPVVVNEVVIQHRIRIFESKYLRDQCSVDVLYLLGLAPRVYLAVHLPIRLGLQQVSLHRLLKVGCL